MLEKFDLEHACADDHGQLLYQARSPMAYALRATGMRLVLLSAYARAMRCAVLSYRTPRNQRK
eukprot:3289098-Rhodomonas_salina.1